MKAPTPLPTLLLCFILPALSCLAVDAEAPHKFNDAAVPNASLLQEESLEDYNKRMEWFAESPYGMFIHFGLYSVLGGEWKGERATGYAEWIQANQDIPSAEYAEIIHQFNPTAFDADFIVRTAKASGMEYLVITAKHHEGFCLWDSAYTEFDVANSPFRGRDILAELAAACEKYDVKFGLYYSIIDWNHPSQEPDLSSEGQWRRWGHNRMRAGWKETYATYQQNQVLELIERYDPALLWFDGDWVEWWTLDDGIKLYNTIHAASPDIIVNNRVAKRANFERDFVTQEQKHFEEVFPKHWEGCYTMNKSWGYKKHDHEWKDAQTVYNKLKDINEKGGNLLLNVGPDGMGRIQPEALEILAETATLLKARPVTKVIPEIAEVPGVVGVEHLLYQDDFSGDLSQWIPEQEPDGTTEIVDGEMDITSPKGSTIWFKHKLEGPVRIEYTATMVDAGGPHDRVSDLNCFWMAIDPDNPDDLFAEHKRTGSFGTYHPLRLYYVGYGANNNTTTRFRRYPGDGSRPMLPEHDLTDEKFMHTPNEPIRIEIIANGSTIQFLRDGELVYDIYDPEPYTEGWFGFRTVRNHMTIDDFRVYRLPPEADQTTSTGYDVEALRSHPVPDWFEAAKFGIFIHWGPYSVLGYQKNGRGYAEWAPRNIYTDPEHYYPILAERFGAHPPEFGYKDLIPRFTAENWNPQAWAELFQQAGARYVVLTAEHHDGYALWDSDLTPWNATEIGPMRDLVGELGVAVRKLGMKYAPSYHRERHNGFFTPDIYSVSPEPHPDIAREIEAMPEAASLYGPFTIDEAFIQDYVARWKEIETKYRPDLMWLDHVPVFHERWNANHDHPAIHRLREACLQMIAEYFEVSETWGKDVYVNNKGTEGGINWPQGIGFRERDNMQIDGISERTWQNPATLGTSYGYSEFEEVSDAYKTSTELIHLLCDVVSRNGNLLLNIGPKADGTIPAGMQRRLRAIGEWLATNGEAIYGTQPWVVADQEKPNLRFTTQGATLYAIAFEKPDAPFTIQLPRGQSGNTFKVLDISLLGSDEAIQWSSDESGIQITPPRELPGQHAWTFQIIRSPVNGEQTMAGTGYCF